MGKSEFIDVIRNIVPTFGEPRQLFYAQYNPEADSKVLDCFDNAFKKAEKDGGGILYGWTFLCKIGPFGKYVMANHHAVWNSPDGYLVDVTPYPKDIPFSDNGNIIFLAVENDKPIDTGKLLVPLPNRYFPIDNNPKLIEYLNKLSEKEEREIAEICKNDFNT